MTQIETHTDGTKWIACTKEFPLKDKFIGEVHVYHPDAKEIDYDGRGGDDTKYQCPHCNETWWIEIDG